MSKNNESLIYEKTIWKQNKKKTQELVYKWKLITLTRQPNIKQNKHINIQHNKYKKI